MSVIKIFAFLDLEKKWTFFKGLSETQNGIPSSLPKVEMSLSLYG